MTTVIRTRRSITYLAWALLVIPIEMISVEFVGVLLINIV